MKNILKLKRWQLFLLIVIPSFWVSPSPLQEIINSMSVLFLAIWLYAIGIYGQEKLETLGLPTRNLNLFKINCLLIPILLFLFFLYSQGQADIESQSELSLKEILIIPISIYLTFAIFYIIIFASKTIAELELKKEVVIGDYFLNIMFFFSLFFGIWILQPKVTRLIAGNNNRAAE